MDVETAWGVTGAVICLALCAMGSATGSCVAASATVGAWKKCYAQNKQAPFLLVTFVGFPLSQTLYGMILLFGMLPKAAVGFPMLVFGVVVGIAVGLPAYLEGLVGAAAADSQAETGQGLTKYLTALGIIETAAVFAMMFALLALRSFPT